MSQALHAIDSAVLTKIKESPLDNGEHLNEFATVLGEDAKRAVTAVDLALSVPSISSQLVDNLNASIHLRALLTSLFLMDESMRSSQKAD